MDVRLLDSSRKQGCEAILHLLPDWFGIEEAVRQFVSDIAVMETWGAIEDGQLIGFVTVKRHFEHAAEIHVMGVLPDHHRRGVGRALLAHVEAALRESGVRWCQVKTLGPSREDPGYARTRAFYAALGYESIEESESRWPGNPCLQMMKRLDAPTG